MNSFCLKSFGRLGTDEWQQTKLLDALPVAVYLTDDAGRLTLFNQTAIDLWGRCPVLREEKWGGWKELYSAEGKPVSPEASSIARALREGRPMLNVEYQAE